MASPGHSAASARSSAVRSSRLRARSPGGGGWGDPLEREPKRVLRDVRDDVLGREPAARDYGVVITADGRAVDDAATRLLRERMRREQR